MNLGSYLMTQSRKLFGRPPQVEVRDPGYQSPTLLKTFGQTATAPAEEEGPRPKRKERRAAAKQSKQAQKEFNAGFDRVISLQRQGQASKGGSTQDDASLVAFVDDFYRREKLRQWEEHGRAYLALCYLQGKQYVWWNKNTGVVDEIPRASAWEARPVFNRIKPISEQILAQIVSGGPSWVVMPRRSTSGAYLQARGAQMWLDWLWQQENLEDLLRDEGLLWAMAAGSSWVRVLWQQDAGSRIPDEQPVSLEDLVGEGEGGGVLAELLQQSGLALGGEGGEQSGLGEGEGEGGSWSGKIQFACPNPMRVFTNPGPGPSGPFRKLLEVTWVHRQELEELYPGLDLTPELEDDAQVPSLSKRVLNGMRPTSLLGGGGGGVQTATGGKYVPGTGVYDGDDLAEMVLLKELWIAPTKEMPQGRYIQTCSGHLLKAIDNPYGRIPYVRLIWFPRAGSDCCDGLIPQLIPVQDLLNRAYGRMNAILNYHGSPPWLVHQDAVIDPRAFNDRSNQMILWQGVRAIHRPERLQPPNLTSNYGTYIQLLERQMDEIASLGGASRGDNPKGSRSGTMLGQMAARDFEARRNVVSRYERSLREVAELTLEVTRRFVTEKQLLAVIGRDGSVMVDEFDPASINQGLTVQVRSGQGMPKTLPEKMDFVKSLMELRLFDPVNNPDDKRMLIKAIEYGDWASLIDDGEFSEKVRIHAENMLLLRGQPVEVDSVDRQEQHKNEHVMAFRTAEFQAAWRKDPRIKQLCHAHLDMHINWADAQQVPVPFDVGEQASSALQQGMPGGGGGPAGAQVGRPGGPAGGLTSRSQAN